ncbi:MAG: hypothetical protein K9N46_15595 [Candidatus Marinimicrobia bacterium]|nr:hypothetical protein [Candidatus Neomarinimicrobiota bacterium]MCF7830107.1 hypothetical protein [Candidatus Neomarinimicrobiota bacterium]MCF7882154.1 hypothetical protein [Candidatus Neomarinimicrobiota bacterium]
MKQDLYFDFRDVLRIPRVALSGKKIWTMFVANIVGYIGFIIFSYIGILASGYSFANAFAEYHFFPFPYDVPLTNLGWGFYLIGGLVWILAYYFANLAVARITYKEFKGDFFFSSGDGWRFVKKHWHPLIFAPVSIVGIIVFFLIMAVIAALLGKIPFVGEFIFSLPYLLYFPVAIFVLYSAIVFLIVITFTPAIVGTSEEDTLEAVFQSYSLLWAQPWRLVTYEVIWGVLTSVASYIFGLVMAGGVWFISVVFGMNWLMGDKLFQMLETALYYLGGNSPVYHQFINLFSSPFVQSGYIYVGGGQLNVTEAIGSGILALSLFAILAVVVSYLQSLDSVGQTMIYIILRKKKDDENLLERKDEDELAEEDDEFDVDDDLDLDLDEDEDLDDTESDIEEEFTSDPEEDSEDTEDSPDKGL